METPAHSSRLYFKSEPLGTITFDSPLQPADVIKNLEAHGREWRESAVPKDLRKFASSLGVMTRGTEFKMKWLGGWSSPVCFGIIEPHGTGSRIRAGFRLEPDDIGGQFVFTLMLFATALSEGEIFSWVLLGCMGLAWIYTAAQMVRRSSGEPMRSRLIEALHSAATEPWKYKSPFATMLSTNGP